MLLAMSFNAFRGNRHLITQRAVSVLYSVVNPRLLSKLASYNVESRICQARLWRRGRA